MQDVFVVSAVRTPIGKQKGVDKEGNEISRAIGARSYEYFKTEVEKII